MEPNDDGRLTDEALDDLLHRSAPAPSQAADETAVQLAREVRDEVAGATPVRRPRRKVGRLALGAVAAVVALTGAGTVAAYQLSIPPFQGLEEGVGRATTGIPVTYTNSLGRKVDCLAFIEYRNLTPDQRDAIEKASRPEAWDGYGQRVLDDLNMPNSSPEQQNNAIMDAVHLGLWEAAHAAVPEMVYMRDSQGPVFAGNSWSCHPGGVDGRS